MMDIRHVAAMLQSFAETNKDGWNELDAAQGDGDLGITILLGARALAESAAACQSVPEWFQMGGKSLRKAAPSTMGILIASALIAAGKNLIDKQEKLTLEDWVSMQQSMVHEIRKRGGAKLGDKTVLDALIPAVEAFADGVQRGNSLEEIFQSTVQAAKQGAEDTAAMVSKIGRSSWLGERAQGHVDGGAWVCYQIYEFLYHLIKGKNNE